MTEKKVERGSAAAAQSLGRFSVRLLYDLCTASSRPGWQRRKSSLLFPPFILRDSANPGVTLNGIDIFTCKYTEYFTVADGR